MKKEMFDELLESVKEMDAIAKGQQPSSRSFDFPDPEVKTIRDRLGVSQEKFAFLLGVSKRTVENWEQSRRHPTGPARSLLRLVEADPEHALRALNT